jgi:hypothetical protein
VASAPFASRFAFEIGVFPKFHSSAFSRISPGQIENLARILRDVLQKVDRTLGGPPYNLSLQDGPLSVLALQNGSFERADPPVKLERCRNSSAESNSVCERACKSPGGFFRIEKHFRFGAENL